MSSTQQNILFACFVLLMATIFFKVIQWGNYTDTVEKAEAIVDGATIIKARNQLNEIKKNQAQINAYTAYCIKHNSSSVPSLEEIASCKNKAITTTLGYKKTYSQIQEKASIPLSSEFKKYVQQTIPAE